MQGIGRPSSAAAWGVSLLLTLGACTDGQGIGLFQRTDKAEAGGAQSDKSGPIRLVERDVEVPEAFEIETEALWDGRPSLGGVWVAHPDSDQPERVIIRNSANGKFVVGALFRRETVPAGPKFQLSSDAASALGVQAGTPSLLRVTALRRETVNADDVTTPASQEASQPTDLAGSAISASDIATNALDLTTTQTTQVASIAPTVSPAPSTSGLDKPYVQIGFFSKKANADNNLAALKNAGLPSRLITSQVNGQTFWRVVAGPAGNATARRQLQASVKNLGYGDAYFVTE